MIFAPLLLLGHLRPDIFQLFGQIGSDAQKLESVVPLQGLQRFCEDVGCLDIGCYILDHYAQVAQQARTSSLYECAVCAAFLGSNGLVIFV